MSPTMTPVIQIQTFETYYKLAIGPTTYALAKPRLRSIEPCDYKIIKLYLIDYKMPSY